MEINDRDVRTVLRNLQRAKLQCNEEHLDFIGPILSWKDFLFSSDEFFLLQM